MDRFTETTYTATPRHFKSEEDMAEWIANHQPEPELAVFRAGMER